MASSKSKAQNTQAAEASKQEEKAVAKKSAKAAPAKKKDGKKNGKPGIVTRAKTYFKNVRTEVKRVVWPTKADLVKYTGAVLGMLVFFGILIAVVDAVIVPVLYAFSGLR